MGPLERPTYLPELRVWENEVFLLHWPFSNVKCKTCVSKEIMKIVSDFWGPFLSIYSTDRHSSVSSPFLIHCLWPFPNFEMFTRERGAQTSKPTEPALVFCSFTCKIPTTDPDHLAIFRDVFPTLLHQIYLPACHNHNNT